jgi:hypothetical protein
MRVRLPSAILTLAAGILLLAGQLPAQTISGIIAGRVTDPNGKPLSSVAITAHNTNTGRDFPASSDEQGYYRILEVPPGEHYEVTAVLGGFQSEKHSPVRVDVGRTTDENFKLKIQTKEETVTVSSTAPMAVEDSPTLSSSFTESEVTEIPVLTRDVNNLALLAPGVVSVRTFSFASTLVPFSVNGSRGRDNNFIIDSVDNNEPLFGGAASQFTNNDIFQEYTILTDQVKAEFGRNSGGTVNAITKSGSNNWHGTMFGFGQDDRFNAMNQVEKQALLTSPETSYDTTLGLTLGGPVKKDKSFFFLSYQWDRLADNLSDVFPVLTNYPTMPSQLTALNGVTGVNLTALNTYLGTASVNRVPAQANITPCFFATPVNQPPGVSYRTKNPCIGTAGVAGNPAFQTPVNVPGGGTVDYNVFNVPNANAYNLRDHQLSGRFDQRINNSNDVYARYLFDDVASPRFPLNSAGVAAFSDVGLLPDWQTLNRARTQSALIDHRFQRVNSLNEFRLSYSRVSQAQGAFNVPSNALNNQSSAIISDQFVSPGILGPLGGQGGAFASAGSLLTVGTDSLPTRISSNTYQIQDNYSYTFGRHNLKFGANFVKIDSNSFSAPDALGFYLYSGFFSGNGFQDYLTDPGILAPLFFGTPANSLQNSATAVSQRLVDVKYNAQGQAIGLGPDFIKIKEFDQFYFAQDDWRARNNLTFSFGIRYENFGQPINSIHDVNPVAPFVNTDNKDFAPRFGFAWSPWKDWVVRGGYNIQYNPPILDIPLLIWQSGPVSPLFTTDNIGIAQLQPNCVFNTAQCPTGPAANQAGAYPNPPLNIADLQRTFQTGAIQNGNFVFPVNIGSGMVQGCSLYDDLYNQEAPFFAGFPSQPTPFASRAYDELAGAHFNPAGPVFFTGSTVPANIPITQCSDQNTVARNLKNPYVQNWSLGVQHPLGKDYLLEVDYVGSKGTRLFQRVDENPFAGWQTSCLANVNALYGKFGLGSLAVPGQCRLPRVDDSHGDILEITNGGSSTYNALQASLTKRYSNTKYFGDVTFTAAYTWSHLIDNTSEIFGPGFRFLQSGELKGESVTGAQMNQGSLGGLAFLFDPVANAPVESITPLSEISNLTTKNERGNSSFDRRQRFVSSVLWEPFPKKNIWLRGWQLNGVFFVQSGQPFSPLNASPLSPCADATGGGYVGNTRPLIGNPSAPISSVALINVATDPFCVPPGTPFASGAVQGPLSYVDLNGNPIDPKTAHFVQVPLGVISPLAPVAGGKLGPVSLNTINGTETFTPAGRNILIGPRTTDLDLALFRNLKFGKDERYTLQFRWEVYDVLNHPNLGYFNGSPFISDASGAAAFAFSSQRTGASITGGIPENAIDAIDGTCQPASAGVVCPSTGRKTNTTFLSTSTMNTGNRRMQFGLRLIF